MLTAGRSLITRTLAKRVVLVALVASLALIGATRLTHVFSDRAHVNAERRDVVAPFPAIVIDQPPERYADYPAGAPLVRLSAMVPDGAGLARVEREIADLKRGLEVLHEHRASIAAQRAALQKRMSALVEGARANLVEQIAAREAEQRSLAAEMERRERDLLRSAQLAERSIVSDSGLDQIRALARQSEQNHIAAQRRLAAAQTRLRLLAEGHLIDEGGSDVGHTAHRIDELALRLIDLDRDIVRMDLALQTAHETALAERRLFEERNVVTFVSERAGRILSAPPAKGAAVPQGAVVLSSADCGAVFIDIVVSEEQGASFRRGQEAFFRLAGDNREWRGVIEEIAANGAAAELRPSFAPLRSERKTWSLARIAPESAFRDFARGFPDCGIGRSAVVKTSGSAFGQGLWAALRDVF